MGIKKFKPVTPSRRNMTALTNEEITKVGAEKKLVTVLKKNAGRNNSGKITVEGTNNSYGSLIGTANNSTINNSKWLLNTAPSAIGSLQGTTIDNSERIDTIEEMPSVLEIINGEGVFKEDTNNINNSYPILEWE